MRLVIDKGVEEVQLLQESFDKSRKIYTIKAIEGSDKFIYGKKLNVNEAIDAVRCLRKDDIFKECSIQILNSDNGDVVWTNGVCESKIVSESSSYFDELNVCDKEETDGKWESEYIVNESVNDTNIEGVVESSDEEDSKPVVEKNQVDESIQPTDMLESRRKMVWKFHNESATHDKMAFERRTISTFFKMLSESNVRKIVFKDSFNEEHEYDMDKGSRAYADFKRDLRKDTDQAAGKHAGYGMSFDDGVPRNSDVNRVDDSDFEKVGSTRHWDYGHDGERVVKFTAKSWDDDDGGSKKKKPTEDGNSSVEEMKNTTVVAKESTEVQKKSNLVRESIEIDIEPLDPDEQIKRIQASMHKFDAPVIKQKDSFETSGTPSPVMPKGVEADIEVVQEADDDPPADDAAGGGDDAGGGDADPFAGGDDAGGDAGADAGGDADPFAGGGQDDAGGDAGGGDADPFAGGQDDAGGGDAGGGEAADADPFGGGQDGAATGDAGGGDSAEGEPAPEPAINTDAQGEPQSQYNINVTKPFNANNDFSLNEDEQKEFFGKIDQLVKIPDMDNYSLYLYQITPDNLNLDDVHYITALYELSVKLGLLEDAYADSNLLDKYSDYKYSVVKNGDAEKDGTSDGLKIQESKYLFESKKKKVTSTSKAKVQKDNEKKTEVPDSDDDRRGPKDTKLNKDKNGADKPIIIDTNSENWGNKNIKLDNSTEMDNFRGLGWVVTFKAMQFGSPRYMTMYIKKNGDEKAETQCRNYLEKLSYSDIDIVKIEEIDPYEYIYRTGCSGMKSVEEVHGAAVVNKDIPYLESSEPSSIPNDVKRDIKRVITKLNSEIRGTKQFNFIKECGVEKPQLEAKEFLECYKTAQVDETIGDTIYKFVMKKNDSTMSRMFFSNMKEKLFKYLGSFAQKFGLECGCESTPNAVVIDFTRSSFNNPMGGYDLDTMVDANTDEVQKV